VYRDGKKQVTDCIGRVRTIGSGIWTKGTGTNGTADVSSTIRGKSVKIEIKWQKDKQSMLNIEEQKGTIKDSIISNKSLIIVEKDNIINSHQEIEINLNKSLRKEKSKKNFWKLTSGAILIGAGYLLVK